MHRHAETRFLPFTPKQLFDLVADVGRYPEFLPWCIAARVTARGYGTLSADLVVGKGPFRESFISKVTLDEGGGSSVTPPRIEVDYIEGPMREMTNRWLFLEAPGGTELDFLVALEFKSRILEGLMGAFFDDAAGDLILADIGIPPGAYAWETLKLPYTPPFGDRFLVPLTMTSV